MSIPVLLCPFSQLIRIVDAFIHLFAAGNYDWDRLTSFQNLLKLELGGHEPFCWAPFVKPATLAVLTTLSLLEEFVRLL